LVAALATGGLALGVIRQALGRGAGTLDQLGRLRPQTLGGLALLAWASGAVHLVPAGHVGIVERVGRPLEADLGPGLHLRLPPPFELLTHVDLHTVRSTAILEAGSPLLCSDPSLVTVEAGIHWSVKGAQDFAFHALDPEAELTNLVRAALVEAVAHRSQDTLLTAGREELQATVLAAAQAAADAAGLGVRIEEVHMGTIAPPAAVQGAYLDVINAGEEQQQAINLAEAYAADLLPRARGEAGAHIARAQGDALHTLAEAEGDTTWFHTVRQAGGIAMDLTRHRLTLEHTINTLGPARLIVRPAGIRIWLTDGTTSVDTIPPDED
jgi:membrane protease subunit HflK